MLMFFLYLLLMCVINKNILIYSICRRYDEMVEKVSDVLDIIEEIVGFQEYFKIVSFVEKKIEFRLWLYCYVDIICVWIDWDYVFCSFLMLQFIS